MCLFVSAKLTHTMPRQSWYGADHIASQSDSVSYTPKDEIRAANRSLRRHAPSLLAKERPVSSSAKRHRAAKKRAAMKERREARCPVPHGDKNFQVPREEGDYLHQELATPFSTVESHRAFMGNTGQRSIRPRCNQRRGTQCFCKGRV